MNTRNRFRRAIFRLSAIVLLLPMVAACGFIADKDRIRIAKMDDRYITRGDLFRIIREMSDAERPIIRNRGDLLRVLNDYINEQIKRPLADEVQQEVGKDLVSREAAAQRYFVKRQKEHEQSEGEKVDFQAIYNLQDPKVLDISQAELDGQKQEMDVGIDRELEKMRSEAAVMYRALKALKDGSMTITQEELEQEYRLRKDELKKLEWMKFRALRFPADMPNSEIEAANVRKRLNNGELFDSLIDEYKARIPGCFVESEIENNPTLERFRGFWLNASGAQRGDYIGPVFLPQYQVMVEAQGQARAITMPDAYLVLEVLDHRPEQTLSIEEAKPALEPDIAVAKMMRLLREQHGVVIYEDKLPDPSMFEGQLKPAA